MMILVCGNSGKSFLPQIAEGFRKQQRAKAAILKLGKNPVHVDDKGADFNPDTDMLWGESEKVNSFLENLNN